MRRLLLAVIVSLGALLLIARLAGDGGDRREQTETMPEGKPRLFYELEPEDRLSLALAPEVERVKLIVLRQLPPGTGGGPEARYTYGLTATLLDARGQEVWRTPVWFESRVTWSEPVGPGETPLARAWLPSGEGVLTDERVIELDLSPVRGAGGELVLEAAAGAHDPVLVRPYRRAPGEEDAGGLFRWPVVEERHRQRLAERAGSTLFSELDPSEQEALSRFRWQRMEASGARGRDYVAARVILTGYRRDEAERPAPGTPGGPGVHALEPGQAVAFNLRGPARLELLVEPEGRAGGASAQVVTVSQGGRVTRSALQLDGVPRAGSEQSLTEGEVVSLALVNDGSARLSARVLADGVEGLLFGRTSAVFDASAGRYLLIPDTRVSAMYRTTGRARPVEYELRGEADDRIRVEARSVDGAGAGLQLELLDGRGEVLSTGRLDCPAGRVAWEETRGEGPAGVPARVELWVGEARRLRLWSDRPVDVSVSVPLASDFAPGRPDPTYALELTDARLRSEPLAWRRWGRILPEGVRELREAGRQIDLVGQVRIEPTAAEQPADLAALLGWPSPTARAREVAWLPEGAPPGHRLLERWTRRAGPWPAGAWTQLPPGRPIRLQRPTGGAGDDLRLRLWLDEREPAAADATLWADDRRLARLPVGASAVETTVGPLPAGEPSIRLDTDSDGLTALVDWPPARRGQATGLYRQRTVFRLERGSLRATLPVGEDGRTVLYVLAYREPGQRLGRVAVRVEGDRPVGVPFERTTPVELSGPLVAAGGEAGFLADRAGARLVPVEPIRIPLGDDLGRGRAEVVVRRLDGEGPLWVRLVASGPEAAEPDGGDQWIEKGGARLAGADPFVPTESLVELVQAELSDPRGPFLDAPTEALERARELGWQLLDVARRGEPAALGPAAEEARALGFELSPVEVGDQRFLVLRGADAAEGRGLLLLRFGGTASQVLLQAPHAVSDLGTGELAARLMEGGDALALQLNTRHRRAADGPAADLAHRDDTWFQALTLGLLDGLERPLLAQLHGFGCETVDQPGIDLVVSGGVAPDEACVDAFVGATGELLPGGGVAVYPRDIDVLGALTNVQGQAVAALDRGAFLHLEMSRDLRERLRADDDALGHLLSALDVAAAALDEAGEEAR